MSGKTRPDTGCVLVSEPRVDRVGKAQVLNAELVTSDGYVATASFETPWFLQLGAVWKPCSAQRHRRVLPQKCICSTQARELL